MIKEYGLSRDDVLFALACVEGWAYLAAANESASGLERVSAGYLAQEQERLM